MPPRKRKTTEETEEMSTVATIDEGTETTGRRRYTDLSPQALGVSEQNFEDFDGELPKQSSNDKYSLYYDMLEDSYQRGVGKRVTGIENPEALLNALRNAASSSGIGIDTRIVTEEGESVVYFKGREKRGKRALAQ
jgi:hypothetical protein